MPLAQGVLIKLVRVEDVHLSTSQFFNPSWHQPLRTACHLAGKMEAFLRPQIPLQSWPFCVVDNSLLGTARKLTHVVRWLLVPVAKNQVLVSSVLVLGCFTAFDAFIHIVPLGHRGVLCSLVYR